LGNPLVGNQHDAPLWRAVAYTRQGRYTDARRGFQNVDAALGTLPVELQRAVLKDMMLAAIEVGDMSGARNTLHDMESLGIPRDMEASVAVLAGRLAEGSNQVSDAIRAYQAAADSWDRPAAAQGRLREIVLQHSLGSIDRNATIGDLETLTTIWR